MVKTLQNRSCHSLPAGPLLPCVTTRSNMLCRIVSSAGLFVAAIPASINLKYSSSRSLIRFPINHASF
ncbi:MAG: hypothetical protein LBP80_08280, partial [Treponema sp.]|nr:hypothetical protein [Treponema sp.]